MQGLTSRGVLQNARRMRRMEQNQWGNHFPGVLQNAPTRETLDYYENKAMRNEIYWQRHTYPA